jgi:hypothetical protein
MEAIALDLDIEGKFIGLLGVARPTQATERHLDPVPGGGPRKRDEHVVHRRRDVDHERRYDVRIEKPTL